MNKENSLIVVYFVVLLIVICAVFLLGVKHEEEPQLLQVTFEKTGFSPHGFYWDSNTFIKMGEDGKEFPRYVINLDNETYFFVGCEFTNPYLIYSKEPGYYKVTYTTPDIFKDYPRLIDVEALN